MRETRNYDPAFQVAEIELKYNTTVKASLRPHVASSANAAEILRQAWNQERIELAEDFKVLFLNRANKVLALLNVSTGSSTGTIVDAGHVLSAAILCNAKGIILAHNHPSGLLAPSASDRLTTEKIKQAALCHDIQVLDHVILTKEGYYSMADEGVI